MEEFLINLSPAEGQLGHKTLISLSIIQIHSDANGNPFALDIAMKIIPTELAEVYNPQVNVM